MPLPRRQLLIESALRDIEELGHFPSEEARRRAIDNHIKNASRPLDLVVGIVILGATTIAAYYFARFLLPRILPSSIPASAARLLREVLAPAIAILTYMFTLRALHRLGAAPELRRRLLKEGVPVCLHCGYLLRGLPPSTNACPECGRPLTPEAAALLSSEATPSKSTDPHASIPATRPRGT